VTDALREAASRSGRFVGINAYQQRLASDLLIEIKNNNAIFQLEFIPNAFSGIGNKSFFLRGGDHMQKFPNAKVFKVVLT
jgi:hypothetical protein